MWQARAENKVKVEDGVKGVVRIIDRGIVKDGVRGQERVMVQVRIKISIVVLVKIMVKVKVKKVVMETIMDNLLVFTVDEAAEKLHVGRSTIFKLIREGSLPTIKVGKRRLIPVDALEMWVRDQTEVRDGV
jgi:excisionase family DNA binding protein